MIDGLPVVIDPTPPPPVAGVEPPPDPNMPETGEAVGVWGNDDPTVLEEPPGPPEPEPVKLAPPATTDGPVLTWNEEDGRPDFLDANGMPLITAYAPNVPEDETGPKPDQK